MTRSLLFTALNVCGSAIGSTGCSYMVLNNTLLTGYDGLQIFGAGDGNRTRDQQLGRL